MTDVLIPRHFDRLRAHAFLAWLGANVPELGGLSISYALRLGAVASVAIRADDFDAWRERMSALVAPDALDALAVAAVGILEPPMPGESLPEPFATLLAAEEKFAADGLDPDALADFVAAEIAAGSDAINSAEDLLSHSASADENEGDS